MNRLREARTRAGYSQKEVSIILKVAAPTVSQWESGLKNPTQKNLVKLADLYGVTTDYLLGKDIKKEPATNGKLSPKTQELIDKLSQMDQDQLQALEKAVDLVLSLRKE